MHTKLTAKLRRTMNEESTIDLDEHAQAIASAVFASKQAAIELHMAAERQFHDEVPIHPDLDHPQGGL